MLRVGVCVCVCAVCDCVYLKASGVFFVSALSLWEWECATVVGGLSSLLLRSECALRAQVVLSGVCVCVRSIGVVECVYVRACVRVSMLSYRNARSALRVIASARLVAVGAAAIPGLSDQCYSRSRRPPRFGVCVCVCDQQLINVGRHSAGPVWRSGTLSIEFAWAKCERMQIACVACVHYGRA